MAEAYPELPGQPAVEEPPESEKQPEITLPAPGEGIPASEKQPEEALPEPVESERPAAAGAALLAAVQFLLVSPAFIRRTFTHREMGASVGFYPLVGLLLGGILALLDGLLGLAFPPAVLAALLLAAWVGLTGALHLDGFLDSLDGLLGGFTPESRLRIMRDERVGGYALAGGILLLLVQHSALSSLLAQPAYTFGLPGGPGLLYPGAGRAAALLLAPVVGRLGMSLAVIALPYARPSGLGKAIKDNAGPAQMRLALAAGLLTVLAVSLLDRSWAGLAALAVAALAWLGATRFALARIPGLTGDLYGAINILIETVVLLTYVAAQNL